MRKELLSLADELELLYRGSYYNDPFKKMEKYLSQKLDNSPNKNEIIEQIIDNMDIIIKYTNLNNMNWYYDADIVNHPKFLKQLASNIHYFRYPKDFYYFIKEIVFLSEAETIFSDELIDAIVPMNIEEEHLCEIIDLAPPEQRIIFVQKCLDKNIIPVHMINTNYTEEIKDLIAQALDEKIDYCNDVLYLRKIFQEDEQRVKIVNQYINNNPKKVIDSIIKEFDHNFLENEDLKLFFYHIVKELVENEKVNYSDIKVGLGGAYCDIVFIGNKVLKIGYHRKTKSFPNNPYILKPLLRQEVEFGKDVLFLEITEKVEDDRKKISDETLYDLYRNMRNLGLIWTDVAARNVGRLIKDNIIHWNEDIRPSDETLGLSEYRRDEELKAMDYVILDADYIFDENDPNIEIPANSRYLYNMFEERYQREKAEEDELDSIL